MIEPGTLGIIGVGSIGGSIALAAQRRGWSTIGYDRDPLASDCAGPQDVYDRADVLVIATHLESTVRLLRELAVTPPARARLILDVASVKVPIIDAAAGLAHFVASHPMAGTERSGRAAASAELFDGRTWAYVPGRDAASNERARTFIEQLGAHPFAVDAYVHDRVVAVTSHVPQVVASAVAAHVRELAATAGDGVVDALCGPAARELLRLSRSGVDMWRDILHANAAEVAPQLRAIAEELLAIVRALEDGDHGAVERVFARGNPRR